MLICTQSPCLRVQAVTAADQKRGSARQDLAQEDQGMYLKFTDWFNILGSDANGLFIAGRTVGKTTQTPWRQPTKGRLHM